MHRFVAIALALVSALAAACAPERGSDSRCVPEGLGPSVVQGGIVYIPVSVASGGCVLYRVRVPGGQAPAALMYRSEDGEFSYDPPERCVTKIGTR